MSRAFVKEDDEATGAVALPDRPISAARNLVTRRGLQLIERQLAESRADLARLTDDPEARERAAREVRYWTARRVSAELSEPDPAVESAVFGTAVTVRHEDGRAVTLRIVGEDEADPAAGRIAWTAPIARALLGAEPGETRELPSGRVEVTAIAAAPEPLEKTDPA